jgi:transcriptional regulator with XRE-family HTH domain
MKLSIIERVKCIINQLGTTPRSFANNIGFNYSTLNNYLTGRRTTIDSELITKIASSFEDISSEWLLRGEGDMFKPQQELSTKPQPTLINTEAGTPEASVLYQIYNDTIKRMKELVEENTNLKNQITELSEGSEEIANLLREVRSDNKRLDQENRELKIEVMIKDAQLSEKEKAVSDYKELLKEAI